MIEIEEELPVHTALRRYYLEHDLPSDGGIGHAWFWVRIGRLKIPLPNPSARKAAVLYHDMHHLATGYNTIFTQGEMIIAGYEIGTGCGGFAVAWIINLWMLALAIVVTPRRTFAAFVRGRRCDSLYHHPGEAERFAAMTLSELRSALRLTAPEPRTTAADRALFAFWCTTAIFATIGSAAVVAGAVWLLYRGVLLLMS